MGQAPEVVVALLGHGAMISKFCGLKDSPQNNEATELTFCWLIMVIIMVIIRVIVVI